MEEQNCALFQGCVYKLAPMSTTTFTFYKTAKDYVMSILGNMMIADVVAGQANQISSLLSEPECTSLTQMKIDFDYIEVLPKGWFFKIDEKKFVKNPENLKGTPRAFVAYHYNGKVPKPRKFIEGISSFIEMILCELF